MKPKWKNVSDINLITRPSLVKYIREEFYVSFAYTLGMTPRQVIYRAKRRRHACVVLGVKRCFITSGCLENPFIESHAWKFLVRECLNDARRDRAKVSA